MYQCLTKTLLEVHQKSSIAALVSLKCHIKLDADWSTNNSGFKPPLTYMAIRLVQRQYYYEKYLVSIEISKDNSSIEENFLKLHCTHSMCNV